jgi:hypothetical protein
MRITIGSGLLLFGGLAIGHTKLRRYQEWESVKFKQVIVYFKQLDVYLVPYGVVPFI